MRAEFQYILFPSNQLVTVPEIDLQAVGDAGRCFSEQTFFIAMQSNGTLLSGGGGGAAELLMTRAQLLH